jgi:hypothetical protein
MIASRTARTSVVRGRPPDLLTEHAVPPTPTVCRSDPRGSTGFAYCPVWLRKGLILPANTAARRQGAVIVSVPLILAP